MYACPFDDRHLRHPLTGCLAEFRTVPIAVQFRGPSSEPSMRPQPRIAEYVTAYASHHVHSASIRQLPPTHSSIDPSRVPPLLLVETVPAVDDSALPDNGIQRSRIKVPKLVPLGENEGDIRTVAGLLDICRVVEGRE